MYLIQNLIWTGAKVLIVFVRRIKVPATINDDMRQCIIMDGVSILQIYAIAHIHVPYMIQKLFTIKGESVGSENLQFCEGEEGKTGERVFRSVFRPYSSSPITVFPRTSSPKRGDGNLQADYMFCQQKN